MKYDREYTPEFITELKTNEIFVFGSNIRGMHGGGAARIANKKFGAEWGVGEGLTGQCYALPTMEGGVDYIAEKVRRFLECAKTHPEMKFYVTKIACGIAGFTVAEIGPLFSDAIMLENVILPKEFVEEIEKFTEWMNDFQVTDYTGRTSQITTYNGEKEYLENAEKNNEKRTFNIVNLEDDKLVGTVGLESINWIERSAVLGIFIGDNDFRSNGYGTEAIKLLLEYGFRYINLHSIRLDLLSVNERR